MVLVELDQRRSYCRYMDWVLVVFSGAASLAAIASAAVAIFEARAARRSKADADLARDDAQKARNESERLAGEANAAFVRQAEAQERANALKESELRVPVWSAPRRVTGDLRAVTNMSGRALRVVRFEVSPEEADGYVSVDSAEDGYYGPGDSIDYAAMLQLSIRPKRLTAFWRYDDEPEMELARLDIPL